MQVRPVWNILPNRTSKVKALIEQGFASGLILAVFATAACDTTIRGALHLGEKSVVWLLRPVNAEEAALACTTLRRLPVQTPI